MNNFHNIEDLGYGFSETTLTMSREAYPGEDGDIKRFGRDYVSYDLTADEFESNARQGALEGIILESLEDASFVARVIARAAANHENPVKVIVTAKQIIGRADCGAADAIFAERAMRKAIRDAADRDLDSFIVLSAHFPAVILDDNAANAEDLEGVISGIVSDEKDLEARVNTARKEAVKEAVTTASLAPWMTKQFSKKGQKAVLAAARSNRAANVASVENEVATIRKGGYEFSLDLRTGVITGAKRRQPRR